VFTVSFLDDGSVYEICNHSYGPPVIPTVTDVRNIISYCESFCAHFINDKNVDIENRKRLLESGRYLKCETPKPKGTAKKGTVYLVFDKISRHTKIGFTGNIKSRLEAIKSSNPHIEIHSIFNGTMADEKELHAHFADKKIHSEWFNLDENDLEFIRSYFHHANLPF